MASILSHLADRDARRVVRVINALGECAEDSTAFVHHMLNQLAEEVGSDLTTLSVCDLRQGTRRVVGRQGETISATDRAAFDRHFREHPLVRFHSSHPGGPAQRISDCMPQQQFQHFPIFSDYYRPLGIRHVLALPLRIDPAHVISIVFNRSTSNFRDHERALLEALRRPLAALYSNIITREQLSAGMASLQDLAASGGWHLIRLGANDRPIEMSERASFLMHRFFGASRSRVYPRSARCFDKVGYSRPCCGGPAALLPDAIADWLRRSRNWGLDRWASESNSPLTVMGAAGKLSVRFVCDPLSVQGGFLLMKHERGPIDSERLATLSLTRREREVLGLVIAGKTNAEIAQLLTISARTVQKHLEHVFQKLGVETRTAAAVHALAAADEGFEI